MNVLMVVAPAPAVTPARIGEKRPPMGVGLLISILRQAGHTVYFEDLYLKDEPIFADPGFLVERKIDFVGIYTSTITYPETLRLVNELEGFRREGVWNGKIVLGGPHISYGSADIPMFVDHMVVGEGEQAIRDIVEGRADERILRREFIQDLDTLPQIPWRDFIYRGYNWTAWGLPTPVYTFNTSRGCPYSCSFCSVKGIWGRTYRFMSAERILDDIGMMIQYYGLRSAYFREDHFTLNRKRMVAFCEGLLRRGYDVKWACESRADSLDKELLTLMARSGCSLFYMGVESGSQRMLDYFRKGETVEQLEQAIVDAKSVGIKTYASMIVGAPGETEEDLRLTRQFIERVRPDYMYHNVFIGYPGSELYDLMVDMGLCLYEDPVTRMRYMKGHDERVRQYYKGDPRYFCPVKE